MKREPRVRPRRQIVRRAVLRGVLLGTLAALVFIVGSRYLPSPRSQPDRPALTNARQVPLPTELVPLGTLPDFRLTDENGRPFDKARLAGRTWVVDFFFTRCKSVCPLLTQRMQDVARWSSQPRYADRVGLLSITVDPEHDTATVLADYAKAHGLDTARWHLATGDHQRIAQVARDGFKLEVGEPQVDGGNVDILHGSHLVVVDGEGRIRGYFTGDAEGVAKLEGALGPWLDRGGDRGEALAQPPQ